jgi:hypothetical protein
MKKIILDAVRPDVICISEINMNKPIISTKNGEITGMIIKTDDGFIHKLSVDTGSSGYYSTLEALITFDTVDLGYTFLQDIELKIRAC